MAILKKLLSIFSMTNLAKTLESILKKIFWILVMLFVIIKAIFPAMKKFGSWIIGKDVKGGSF